MIILLAKQKLLIIKISVDKAVDNLKKNKFIYLGKIKAPEDEDKSKWVEREQLLFKSTEFGDDKDRPLQKSDKTWTFLRVMLLIIKIKLIEILMY